MFGKDASTTNRYCIGEENTGLAFQGLNLSYLLVPFQLFYHVYVLILV